MSALPPKADIETRLSATVAATLLMGYGDFDNSARPDGWNIWLTFALSPAGPPRSHRRRPRSPRRRAAEATDAR